MLRWVHFLGNDREVDAKGVLDMLKEHGLANDHRFFAVIEMNTLDACDVWGHFWWLTPAMATRLVAGINASHRLHADARRTPTQVIQSALFD